MQIIKGFVTSTLLLDNTPGVLSKLGEISDSAYTFSKEKGEYTDVAYPNYQLTTFKCINNLSQNPEPVMSAQVSEIIQIVKRCVDYSNAKIKPLDHADLFATLTADFGTKITNLQFGAFVDGGAVTLPEWISWTSENNDKNSVTIWLSNDAFVDEFDDFMIEVIPPVADLDVFFSGFTNITTKVNERTMPDWSDLINSTSNGEPETLLRFEVFNYINPLNPAQTLPTTWAVLIYGLAGDNIDSIKDAIIDYILRNSKHTRDEWAARFPDLFKRTEFVILPRWDLVAIPNLSNLSALYSSIVQPAECTKFASDNIAFYPKTHIEANINIMPHDYKCLMLLVINGKDNVDGKKTITELFNDYLPISTASPEFNRMTIPTRDWLILVEKLLIAAEIATDHTRVDRSVRKVHRDGNLYVSAVYKNVNYLVAAKINNMFQ